MEGRQPRAARTHAVVRHGVHVGTKRGCGVPLQAARHRRGAPDGRAWKQLMKGRGRAWKGVEGWWKGVEGRGSAAPPRGT